MNPDELPERDFFQISYGDFHYRVTLQGSPVYYQHIRHEVFAATYRALQEFHGVDWSSRSKEK